jgi:hypothetical protein
MKTSNFMLNRKSSSWFYPKPTGDPGRDRNARTLQITCLLFAFTIGIVAALDTIPGDWEPLPILDLAVVGFDCSCNHESGWDNGVGGADGRSGYPINRNSARFRSEGRLHRFSIKHTHKAQAAWPWTEAVWPWTRVAKQRCCPSFAFTRVILMIVLSLPSSSFADAGAGRSSRWYLSSPAVHFWLPPLRP